MRRTFLAPIVVFFAVSPLACSGDDEVPSGLPTGDPDLIAMVDCVQEAFIHLGLVVETSIHLFHELDAGERTPYTPPFEFGYDESTGEFWNSATLNGVVTTIDGTVAPLEVVADGLNQNDTFSLEWWLEPQGGLDRVGDGAFTVVHLGLTTLPDQTEAMRITMSTDVWVDTGGTCHTDVNSFGVSVRHLMNDAELSAGLMEFTTISDTQILTGLLTIDALTYTGNINATFKGNTYSCEVDLDTYDVSCVPG
jgi:hypothetical protein